MFWIVYNTAPTRSQGPSKADSNTGTSAPMSRRKFWTCISHWKEQLTWRYQKHWQWICFHRKRMGVCEMKKSKDHQCLPMFKGCEEEKGRNRRNLGMGGKKKWEKDSGQGGLGDSGRGMSNGADCRDSDSKEMLKVPREWKHNSRRSKTNAYLPFLYRYYVCLLDGNSKTVHC